MPRGEGRSWLWLSAPLASGCLLAVAFPPVDFGPVAFLALIPLYLSFRGSRSGRAAIVGGLFSFVFFGFLMYWIARFGLHAYFALIMLPTLWIALAFYLAARLTRSNNGWSRGSMFVMALLASEYTRSKFPFDGFSWGGIGYSQHDNLPFLRTAAYAGVWGVGAILGAVNVLLGESALILFRNRKAVRQALRPSAAAALLMLLPLLLPVPSPDGESVRLAMVQGNAPEPTGIPQDDDAIVLQNHLETTNRIEGDVDLVIWPESSFDRNPLTNPQYGRPLVEEIKQRRTPFLVGATIESVDGDVVTLENASLFFRSDGSLADKYEKQHLVPFGEWVPFRSVLVPLIDALEQVPYDIDPGRHSTVFDLPEGRFGSVICFESTFPDLVRSFVDGGARLLIVSTNNISFGRTAASDQHVAFSQLRAAEHRMWVAHTALTGVSAVVDPTGRVVARTGLFEQDLLTPTVRFATKRTVYALTGDWLAIASIAVYPALWILGLMRPKPLVRRPLGRRQQGKALVVIPTYNEAENIQSLLPQVLGASDRVDVLVVDDGSPDGTAALARAVGATQGRVEVLSRSAKQGLGPAYIAGFGWGLERGYQQFVEMDADFSHSPKDIPRLLDASESAGLVIGSRYVPGGDVVGWSRGRHLLSRGGNVYARLLLRFGVRDSTSGFRCYRREVLEAIPLEKVSSDGYAFQVDMTLRTSKEGFEIVEIPITFRERAEGTSKMSRAIVFEAFGSVLVWGLRDLFGAGRRKLDSPKG